MALSLWGMHCLHALLRVGYKHFFLSGLPCPSQDSSLLSPFPILSHFSFPDFWKNCKHHKSHRNFLLSNTTKEASTRTTYNLSSLPSLHSASDIIACHPGMPVLGILGSSLWNESFFLNTLSFTSLGDTNISIFLKKKTECVQNGLVWDAWMPTCSCEPDRIKTVTPTKSSWSCHWKELNQTTMLPLGLSLETKPGTALPALRGSTLLSQKAASPNWDFWLPKNMQTAALALRLCNF